MAANDLILQKGLPANLDIERYLLGAILVDPSAFLNIASLIQATDFSVQSHQLLFTRMVELSEGNQHIDRVTLANELMRHGELESVGGLSYLISLDDGMPKLYDLERYAGIVREHSLRRRLVLSSQALIDRAISGQESADEILASAESDLLALGESHVANKLLHTRDILGRAEADQRLPGPDETDSRYFHRVFEA